MSRTTISRGPPPDPFYRYKTIDAYFDSLPDDISEICVIQKEIYYLPDLSRFKKLRILCCDKNNLMYLPKLPNSLEILYCDSNELLSLPKLPNSLERLECGSNQLLSLPELPDNLKYLDCGSNQLTSLPKLPDKLKEFDCGSNQLSYLPELPNNLKDLDCGSNLLTSLPELPNSLERLDCYSNELLSLPKLPNNLKHLDCGSNLLTSLPELPVTIQKLFCGYNKLTSLPELHKIIYIELFGNPIYYIVSTSKMIENDFDGEIVSPRYRIDYINTIRPNLKILDNFRLLYYCLKFKNKLRDWLWKKVREPKIQQQFHPSRLVELLKDNDIDDIDEETFIPLHI
jgi:hypothetical protein